MHDLRLHNTALLLRWWWRAYNNPTCLWTVTITMIRWTGIYANGPSFLSVSESIFWRKLQALRSIFNCIIAWIIGDGKAISYWFDSWDGTPLANRVHEGKRPIIPRLSLSDAYPIRDNLHKNLDLPSNISFNHSLDKMEWKWNNTGIFGKVNL